MDLRGINDMALGLVGEGQEMECYTVMTETFSVYVDDSQLSLVEHKR